MNKNEIKEIVCNNHTVPEHILKIKDILANTSFTDDEFIILVAGKKDSAGKGYDMNSMYILPYGSLHSIAEAFFAELMMMESRFKKTGIVNAFLSVAQDILGRIAQEVHKRFCTGEKHNDKNARKPC